MKSFLSIVALVLVVSSGAWAQSANFTPAGHEGWLVDIDKAYEVSKSTGKPILANFTGSDWCGWCRRLSAEVFRKKEFQDWAKDNVVLLELDYPRRKQLSEEQQTHNYYLQRTFKVTGFPTIWVFDLNKDAENKAFEIKAIGKTGYVSGGSKAFTAHVDNMISQAKSN